MLWANITKKQSIAVGIFFEFREFSQNRRKEQHKLNSSEHLSKEVKQVLQRTGGGTGVAIKLLKKTKCVTSKTLLWMLSQYSEWVLSYRYFDGQVLDQVVVKF